MGLFLLGTPSGGTHNGGLSQINFNYIGTSSDFPYINLLKTAELWSPVSGSNPVTPDMLDSLGYPTDLTGMGGGMACVFNHPTAAQYRKQGRTVATNANNMVVTWTGGGTIAFSSSNTVLPTATFTGSVAGGVLTVSTLPTGGTVQKGMILSTGGIVGDLISGTQGAQGTYGVTGGSSGAVTNATGGNKAAVGRYVFSIAEGTTGMAFRITALPVTNVKIFQVDDEAAINAGEIFAPKFKEEFEALNFGELRFLNWQANNNTNVTTWNLRRTRDYCMYGSGELRANLYAGVSTGTSAYVTANRPAIHSSDGTPWLAGEAPKDKDLVHWKVGNTGVNVNAFFTATIVASTNVMTVSSVSSGTIVPNMAIRITSNDNSVGAVVSQISGTAGGAGDYLLHRGIDTVTPTAITGVIYTLDIGNTGTPKVLLNRAALPIGTASKPEATSVGLATVTYCSLVDAWMMQGGGDDPSQQGIVNGAPIEDMIQLCTELRTHPHFEGHHLTLSPMSDYMPEFAAYCEANCPSWMIPRFEGPNELWNDLPLRAWATSYAKQAAVALGYGVDNHNWYGRVCSTMGQAIAAAYGDPTGALVKTQTRYQMLIAVQTIGATGPGPMAEQLGRFNATKYVAGGVAQSGYVVSDAKSWATHLCPAQYYCPAYYKDPAVEPGLIAAFKGKAFTASITNGIMDITNISGNQGAASLPFEVGDLVFDSGIWHEDVLPAGLTIVSLSADMTPMAITAVTATSPPVVSVASPPANGSRIYIKDVAAGGMTQVPDGWYTTANATAGSFQLLNYTTSNIDGTLYSPYTSGGTATKLGQATLSDLTVSVPSQKMTACATLAGAYAFADSTQDPLPISVTFVNGTPGQVVYATPHGLAYNDRVNIHFTYPSGTGPSGVSSSTTYFVGAVDSTTVIKLSTTINNANPVAMAGAAGVGAYAFKGFHAFTRQQNKFYAENWKAFAIANGIMNMGGYEGGYSPDLTGGDPGNSQDDYFRIASLMAPGLEQINTDILTDFVNLSGGGFIAQMPSNYNFSGGVARGYGTSIWSMMNDIYQSPKSPQYLSVIAFNN